jgi:PPOX class probable F420-dependent enzyme
MGSATALSATPEWTRAMLETGRVGRLGVIDDDSRPRVLPVTFALHEGRIYSAVDEKRKSRKGEELARVRYLRERPDVALTVDRYSDDWSDLAWVQVLALAAIVDVGDAPGALAALSAKYEEYGRSSPAGPLIQLDPQRFLWWSARGG